MLYVLALVLLLGAAALLAVLFLKPPQKPSSGPLRYVRRELLTPTELQFHIRLREALPAYLVAPQVAMSALVDVANTDDGTPRSRARRGKVSQKRLDFVVAEPATGKVAWVIELDDHTHDRAARQQSDRERDRILKGVGYRVARFDARKMPSVNELREAFTAATR